MGNMSVIKKMVSYIKQAIQNLNKFSYEQEVIKTVEVIQQLSR